MADFKVSPEISTEIETLQTNGKAVVESSSTIDSSGTSTLSTAKRYTEQHKSIASLLNLYIALVEKDAKDLLAMVETAETMDTSLADDYK